MTVARAAAEEVVTLAAVNTAVALVTRLALAPDVPREDVLGDSDPAEVLAAMECIAAGVLVGLQPGDKGAGVLERIGLGLAAAVGGRQTAFPPGRDSSPEVPRSRRGCG